LWQGSCAGQVLLLASEGWAVRLAILLFSSDTCCDIDAWFNGGLD
jgi:hypothetical protein